MKSFKQGTVVMLASGGVPMTIASEPCMAGRQLCVWQHQQNGLFEQRIPISALVEVKPARPVGFTLASPRLLASEETSA